MTKLPTVLCIGGHDPTGGAGIQADIETVSALGARAITIVTTLTAQDSQDVDQLWPTPARALARQMDILLADIEPDAVKIGMLGSAEVAVEVASRLADFRGPIVLDPVLAAGGGSDVAGPALESTIVERLLPLSSLVTPNRAEARRLAGIDDADRAAGLLVERGADAVLLTGADEPDAGNVTHHLVVRGAGTRLFHTPLLDGKYHGSGCTLASACATALALGQPLEAAVAQALSFTRRALEHADRPGRGQFLPRRCVACI